MPIVSRRCERDGRHRSSESRAAARRRSVAAVNHGVLSWRSVGESAPGRAVDRSVRRASVCAARRAPRPGQAVPADEQNVCPARDLARVRPPRWPVAIRRSEAARSTVHAAGSRSMSCGDLLRGSPRARSIVHFVPVQADVLGDLPRLGNRTSGSWFHDHGAVEPWSTTSSRPARAREARAQAERRTGRPGPSSKGVVQVVGADQATAARAGRAARRVTRSARSPEPGGAPRPRCRRR